jgi:hypothetical protein
MAPTPLPGPVAVNPAVKQFDGPEQVTAAADIPGGRFPARVQVTPWFVVTALQELVPSVATATQLWAEVQSTALKAMAPAGSWRRTHLRPLKAVTAPVPPAVPTAMQALLPAQDTAASAVTVDGAAWWCHVVPPLVVSSIAAADPLLSPTAQQRSWFAHDTEAAPIMGAGAG